MRINRFVLALGVCLVALVFGTFRQRSLWGLRRVNAGLSAQIAFATTQANGLEEGLQPIKREIEAQHALRDEAAAKAAALAHELAPGDLDARWSTPPARLPDWDPESPYVWLDKELLTRFPVQPFSSEGALNPTIASVLTLEPEQTQALNANLSRLVADYHAQEAAHAQKSDQPIPGFQLGEGEQITVEVPPLPELGASLKAQFEQTLAEQLGQPRTELVLKTASGWFQEQLSGFGTEPRVLSVVRHPDNTFQIAIKSGSSQMSVGGANAFEDYVPSYLRPFFAPLSPPPVSDPKAAP